MLHNTHLYAVTKFVDLNLLPKTHVCMHTQTQVTVFYYFMISIHDKNILHSSLRLPYMSKAFCILIIL